MSAEDAETPDAVTPEADASATGAAEAESTEVQDAATDASSDSEDTGKRENPRKVREGMVVSTSMDKTAVVEAIDRVRHRRYAKTVQRSRKLFAHDEENDANVGDRVRIEETRPMSKRKRWRLVEVVERAR